MSMKTAAAVFLIAWAGWAAHAGQIVDLGFYRFECVGRPLVVNDSGVLPEAHLVVIEPITDLYPFVSLNGRPMGTLLESRCIYDYPDPETGELLDLVWYVELDLFAGGSPHGHLELQTRLLSDGFEEEKL